MTISRIDRRESDALTMLVAIAPRLPGDYLIVGPQANFAYHRWLNPIYKMVDIRVNTKDVSAWHATLVSPWAVFSQIPNTSQIQANVRIALLQPNLADTMVARRRNINGLNFISPEDCCIELLARARTQISLSEIAALLVRQRAAIDWEYLAEQTTATGLTTRLREIAEAVNREAGRPLLSIEKLNDRPSPDSVLIAQRLKEVISYFPPSLQSAANPRISSATIADVLRGLKAQWVLSDGR